MKPFRVALHLVKCHGEQLGKEIEGFKKRQISFLELKESLMNFKDLVEMIIEFIELLEKGDTLCQNTHRG